MSDMWLYAKDFDDGVDGFFRLGQSHDTLANHYEMNFNLKKYHDWSLDEINSMIPFERDIYVLLIRRWIEEETRKAQERAMSRR